MVEFSNIINMNVTEKEKQIVDELVSIANNSGINVIEIEPYSNYRLKYNTFDLGYISVVQPYNNDTNASNTIYAKIDTRVEMKTTTKFMKTQIKNEVNIKTSYDRRIYFYKNDIKDNKNEIKRFKEYCGLMVKHLKTATVKKRKFELDTEFEQ